MTLNCIHIFIVTGSFLYWYVIRPASRRFFIHSCNYPWIMIISYLAAFLGTNSLSVLMCRKAVNQSIVFDIISLDDVDACKLHAQPFHLLAWCVSLKHVVLSSVSREHDVFIVINSIRWNWIVWRHSAVVFVTMAIWHLVESVNVCCCTNCCLLLVNYWLDGEYCLQYTTCIV